MSDKSQGTMVVDGNIQSAGTSQQLTTTLSAAVGVTPPDGTRWMLMQAEAQDIRWTDDGTTTPTSAIGQLLKANSSFWYNGPINSIKFIRTTAGAILNLSFYK